MNSPSSQTRAKRLIKGPKRARYVAIACETCHGRKLKCSGGKPCERCRKQRVSCSYPVRSPEPSTSDSSTLPSREQLDLLRNIGELQSQLTDVKAQLTAFVPLIRGVYADTTDAVGSHVGESVSASFSTQSRGPRSDSQNHYEGPTSSTYCLSTLDSRLSTVEEPLQTHDFANNLSCESASILIPPERHLESNNQEYGQSSMEQLSLADVERCVDTFQETFGVLHPIPAVLSIKSHASQLLRATQRSIRSQPTSPGDCGLIEMFKCIVATGLVCNGGLSTPLSEALYQSLEPLIANAVVTRTISHEFRTLLLLVTLYHFACDELVLGTRTLMIASRTALEQGLYYRDRLEAAYPEQTEQNGVLNLLWSLFVLDMQFNYASGLPNVMDERRVDLPPPVDAPYLKAMVGYVFLGARAWTSTMKTKDLASAQPPSQATLDLFKYELHCWHQRLDPLVGFDATVIETDDAFFTHIDETQPTVYLKTLLYLRSNQIQILVLRPLLMHKQPSRSEPSLAREAVCLAKKSIKTLRLLASRTNLYLPRRAVFNHFLGSALAVLFLAATHDAEHRSHADGTEVYETLLGDVDELCIGLELVNEVGAIKLARCFERPSRQLIRLGILRPLGWMTRHASSPSINGTINNAGPEALPLPSSDLTADSYYTDESLLGLEWIDDALAKVSAPFGVMSWM